MSVGGKVVEILHVADRVWVNTVDHGHECAIYVERTPESRSISEGDTLWWQGPSAYWTPRSHRKKYAFTDKKLRRIGGSGISREQALAYADTVTFNKEHGLLAERALTDEERIWICEHAHELVDADSPLVAEQAKIILAYERTLVAVLASAPGGTTPEFVLFRARDRGPNTPDWQVCSPEWATNIPDDGFEKLPVVRATPSAGGGYAAEAKTAESCDECNGSGVYWLDDKPQLCICIGEHTELAGRIQGALDVVAARRASPAERTTEPESVGLTSAMVDAGCKAWGDRNARHSRPAMPGAPMQVSTCGDPWHREVVAEILRGALGASGAEVVDLRDTMRDQPLAHPAASALPEVPPASPSQEGT